jgi:predicted dehydrogenase
MRIAVVGTGSVGKRHLANLLTLRRAEVLAVSEFNKHAAVQVDGVSVPVIHSYAQALDQCDAVVIANPSSMHLEYLSEAIAAGKHVYIEKPVAPDSAGLADLHAAAQGKKLVIAVGTQFRFNPALRQVKEIIDRGELGRLMTVLACSGEHIADYHPEEDYRTSYAARRELGGGVLLTQIHQIDYLNWLFGSFASVFAREMAMPELGIDVESSVTYLLNNEQGLPVVGHLNYAQRPKNTSMEIIGSAGRITWSYGSNSLTLYKNGSQQPKVWQTPFNRNTMFLDCMTDFLNAIKNRVEPETTLQAGLAAIRIVESIKKSLLSHAVERVH